MSSYVADIEGNGLQELELKKKDGGITMVPECSKIHCLVLRDISDNSILIYRDPRYLGHCVQGRVADGTIQEGWEKLKQADTVVGHNFIAYDLPVLRRLHSGQEQGDVLDTLVAARLLYPDEKNHPFGGNSLARWGEKLGCPKDNYTGGWDEWNPEMEIYCIQDTAVNLKILKAQAPQLRKLKAAFRIETQVAKIIAAQQDNGVDIDTKKAGEIAQKLELDRMEVLDELHRIFPPRIEVMKSRWWHDPLTGENHQYKSHCPKDVQARLVKGDYLTKEHPFNPGSTKQVAERLKEKHGWDAPLTEEGNPSVTEAILQNLDLPEVPLLLKHDMANKRLQHLNDWLYRAEHSRTPGRIHPFVNTNGAATGRMTHKQPNQTACPKVVRGPDGPVMGYEGRYGWEMRSLWKPREGWLQVGGDASGLELRMLGHALARWDGGDYARNVVEGDIHTLNQKAGGLDTRDQAKTVICTDHSTVMLSTNYVNSGNVSLR